MSLAIAAWVSIQGGQPSHGLGQFCALAQPAPEVPELAGATRPDRGAERDDAASARVVTHGANPSGREQARS